MESSIWVPNVLGSRAILTPEPNTPLVDEPTHAFNNSKMNNIKKNFSFYFFSSKQYL